MPFQIDVMSMINAVLIAAAIASVFGGVILKVAANWVILLDVGYIRAAITVFIAFAINCGLSIPIEMGAGFLAATVHPLFGFMAIVTIPLGVFVQAGVIYWQLDTTYGYSLLITLAMALIGFIVAIVVGFGFVMFNILF